MNPTVINLPTVALRVAVIKTLKPILRFDLRSAITPASTLIGDLSMDSLDRQTVACELEEAFGLELGDDAIASWCTVEDIARSIEEAAGERPAWQLSREEIEQVGRAGNAYPRDFTVVA